MKNIVIIDAGQIGSRHLQAMANLEGTAKVQLVDPSEESLKIADGRVAVLWPENYAVRSQDLMPVYHDCGQFYCLKTVSLLEQMRLFADYTVPMVMSEAEVQDIDNEEDWKLAEMKYQIFAGTWNK